MAEQDKRRLFLIETAEEPDALLRVLSLCAAHQVSLASVDFTDGPGGGKVRIETRLGDEEAVRLGVQLRSIPSVRAVSVGWRAVGPRL